jgi:hypothetical protein
LARAQLQAWRKTCRCESLLLLFNSHQSFQSFLHLFLQETGNIRHQSHHPLQFPYLLACHYQHTAATVSDALLTRRVVNPKTRAAARQAHTVMAGTSVVGVMAGSAGPGLHASGNASLMASLTPDELCELREYGKLLQFRDEVVGGSHPRIKPARSSRPPRPLLSIQQFHRPRSQPLQKALWSAVAQELASPSLGKQTSSGRR